MLPLPGTMPRASFTKQKSLWQWLCRSWKQPAMSCATVQAAGESYGKQRQWGSIGFGLASLPAGWLIDQTSLTSCFLVYGLASLPLLAITSQMRYNYKAASAVVAAAAAATPSAAAGDSNACNGQDRVAAAGQVGGSGAGQQQLSALLRQPAVLLFLWRCLLLGLGMGVMSNYEFLWLKQLGVPEALMGFAIAVSMYQQLCQHAVHCMVAIIACTLFQLQGMQGYGSHAYQRQSTASQGV